MPVRFLPFLALVPAALLALRSAAAQQATTACRPGPWSAPWTLTMSDGRPVYVDVPLPARSSAGLAFLGAPTFVWRTATVFADTGAGAGSMIDPSRLAGAVRASDGDTRLVQMPAGAVRMLAQRAVARRDGSLDVFWGESPDTSYHSLTRVPEVWFAPYGAGGWSAPERLLAFDEIGWNAAYPVVQSVAGEPVVAVPVRRTTPPSDTSGIMYLRRVADGWRRTLIPALGLPPADLALAAVSDRDLVLAFAGSGADSPGSVEPNGVFVVRSHDAGETWSAPQRVAGFGAAALNWLRLVHTADGALHLIWNVDREMADGRHGRTIERAASRDAGDSWERAAAVPNDPFVEFFDAARLGGHVLLVGRYHDDHAIAAAAIAGDGPVRWQRLSFDATDTPPRLAALAPDSLLLTWGTQRAGAYPLFPDMPAPLLEAATITLRCDSVP
ncbi:MAG TPA: sialidase family protein [Gemmatimonadaceae bacterium]